MVYKLSRDDVLKVCGSCRQFLKERDACQSDAVSEPKRLKEIHRCKKWDEFFGGSCVFQG
ncbi:MAG: hypothetical protein ACM3X9_02815 [Bacillota bacterium]